MKVVQIPLLRDNYGYLIVCQKTNSAAIVDPSEAAPVSVEPVPADAPVSVDALASPVPAEP